MIGNAVVALGLGVGSLIAQATFSSTIGLGSILVGMLVVIFWGIFSLRDRRNSGWKDLYEQEREKNGHLLEDMETERIARHQVKDDLATTRALLEIEKTKPDLSVVLDQQQVALVPLVETLQAMQKTQEKMLAILTDQRRKP